MKIYNSIIVQSLFITLLFTSCGGDSDVIKSGKINACKLKCATEEYEKDPTNKELQDKVDDLRSILKTNRELEDDKEAFNKAIKEYVENECKC